MSNFQKILTNFLSIDEKVEKKTRMLVLLSLLLHSFESLVIALPMRKSTIKMKTVTSALFQNKVLKQENQALSSSRNSTLVVSRGVGNRGWSGGGLNEEGPGPNRRILAWSGTISVTSWGTISMIVHNSRIR